MLAAASAFTVNSNGASIAIASAAVSGQTVVLSLQDAIHKGASVSLRYTDPSSGNDIFSLQDLSGNDANSFSVDSISNLSGSESK